MNSYKIGDLVIMSRGKEIRLGCIAKLGTTLHGGTVLVIEIVLPYKYKLGWNSSILETNNKYISKYTNRYNIVSLEDITKLI